MSKFSQNNEEFFVLDYFQNRNQEEGKILEVGAYDGTTFSNVRSMLLKFPKWKSVFVEASSYAFTKLVDVYKQEPRRAELINAAVVLESELGNSNLLQFFDSPMSGVSSSLEGHTNKWYNEVNFDGDVINPRKMYVGKVGMREILDSFGPFDMINIDVEGYSAKLALQEWFLPNNYGCKLLCVEHDGMWKELQMKMSNLGYSTIHINQENIIMAKL